MRARFTDWDSNVLPCRWQTWIKRAIIFIKTISTQMGNHFDVIVVGGGTSGISAALAAAKNGCRTLLIETSSYLGGEMVSGLPLDGCLNAKGQWIVGGIAGALFDICRKYGGYIGPVFDWRLNYGVCLDPEILKLAIAREIDRQAVHILLYSFCDQVVSDGKRIDHVSVINKYGRSEYSAEFFIDCTGDADLAVLAGVPYEKGDATGNLQPVSLIFRMANVDFPALLKFIRDNPRECILAENPIIRKSPAECALEIFRGGLPFVVLGAQGGLLHEAIGRGEVAPTTAIYMWPISVARGEMGLNMTRKAGIDATNIIELSQSYLDLGMQILQGSIFLRNNIPGFGRSSLSMINPCVGIRETRRIVGEYMLTAEDVIEGRKFKDGIAKGAHHIDLHGKGIEQKRIPVKDGRSYDIPYGCLVPVGIKNLLVAGRCISSTRDANGSVRVMGQCLATGEAAGTAAAWCLQNAKNDVREVSVPAVREILKANGAVIDSTD